MFDVISQNTVAVCLEIATKCSVMSGPAKTKQEPASLFAFSVSHLSTQVYTCTCVLYVVTAV